MMKLDISSVIGRLKHDHIAQQGKVPAHVYIPTAVYEMLKAELESIAQSCGQPIDLNPPITLTHIHGMQIHRLPFHPPHVVAFVCVEPV